MVRAKFKLTEIRDSKWHKDSPGSKTLKFSTQYDDTIPEDQRFQKATPSGTCEMQIDNPAAVAPVRTRRRLLRRFLAGRLKRPRFPIPFRSIPCV